jgi:hypothetical protein
MVHPQTLCNGVSRDAVEGRAAKADGLQTRVKTLNRELGSVFKQRYPDMQVE